MAGSLVYISSFVDDELIKIVYTPHEDDEDAMNDALHMQGLTLIEENWDIGEYTAKNEAGEQFKIIQTYIDGYTEVYNKEG